MTSTPVDPLSDLRVVAFRHDVPMPHLQLLSHADGRLEYIKQWPHDRYAWLGWFLPSDEPLDVFTADGPRQQRPEYESPTEALGSILPVQGGTGHLHIGELVALFLVTRLVHDPLARADYEAWRASGRPDVGDEWSAAMEQHSWVDILEREHQWHPHFAELVAHIAEAAGLVEVGYSIYSSALTDRAKAWALIIRIDAARKSGEPWSDDYDALIAMGRDADDE
jgi:hypothetical protein